jgi:hypothetical protein
MAGIPGAGKTEFAENILQDEATSTFVPIEHDKLVEYIPGYKPENYYEYRKAGSALVTEVFDECLRNDYAFIFDGTLSHENGVRNIAKVIKAGYVVYVVYIVQDIAKAWELTQARELTKKRSIEKTGFLETCGKLNKNLLDIFKANKNEPEFNFWLIDKHGSSDLSSTTVIVHGFDTDNHQQIETELQKIYNHKVIE